MRRIFRHADHAEFAVRLGEIDVVVSRAPHGNEFDADIVECADGLGGEIIVDECADDLRPFGDFCGCGSEPCFIVPDIESEPSVLVCFVEESAVIGFRVEKSDFDF